MQRAKVDVLVVTGPVFTKQGLASEANSVKVHLLYKLPIQKAWSHSKKTGRERR